jgi:hypothetical protein
MADTLLTVTRKRGASFTSYEEGGPQLRECWLDATLSEAESIDVEWTEHPLESGAAVTDHAVVKPPQLTLEGLLTRTPIWMQAEQENLDPSHLDTQLDALRGMLADREPILIVTGLRAYEGYRIRNLSISRSPADGQSVRVSMTLAPVQIVEAGTVLLPPLPVTPAKADAAKKEEEGGTKSTTDASDETAAGSQQRTSVLKGGLDKFGASDLIGGGF